MSGDATAPEQPAIDEEAPAAAPRTNPWFLVGGLVGLVVLAALALFAVGMKDDDEPAAREPAADPKVVTSIKVDYPPGWSGATLADTDRKGGILARAESADTGASFLARTVVGELEDDLDLASVAKVTERALLASVEGAKVAESGEVNLIGAPDIDAAHVVYDEAGEPAFRTEVVIVPFKHQALYLTVRAPTDRFDTARASIAIVFTQMASAIATANS